MVVVEEEPHPFVVDFPGGGLLAQEPLGPVQTVVDRHRGYVGRHRGRRIDSRGGCHLLAEAERFRHVAAARPVNRNRHGIGDVGLGREQHGRESGREPEAGCQRGDVVWPRKNHGGVRRRVVARNRLRRGRDHPLQHRHHHPAECRGRTAAPDDLGDADVGGLRHGPVHRQEPLAARFL